MDILQTRAVLRPNVWGPVEVCDAIVRVDAADLTCPCEQLSARLSGMLPEFGSVGETPPHAGSGAESLAHAHLFCRLTLALQLASRESTARFQRVLPTDDLHRYRVVVEAIDPAVVVACMREAVAMLRTLRAGGTPDMHALRGRLVEHADDVCLGPSTMLIVRAAEERGIPWRRLNDLSLVQFGQGHRQRRIWTAETDRTPAIAEAISRDKQLTKRLLAAAGVPVPRGRLVGTAEEAWLAAAEIGTPVVVKPINGNHGRGVFLNLTTRDEIDRAFTGASAEAGPGATVLVEEFIPGVEHRLLVVGTKVAACARGEYLFVTGDGHQTVAELIDVQLNADPRRGRSETLPNKTIEIDEAVVLQLSQEGFAPASVPATGCRVLVKRTGSHDCDVTDLVHPEVALAAVRAARVVGLDIAGVDVVAADISRPLNLQRGRICEVNAGPQLLIHAHPGAGPGRPVGRDIIATLFGPGDTGRVPIVALLGIVDANIATDLDARLRSMGRSPAVTCSAGMWVGGVPCRTDDCSGVEDARAALVSPDIDTAIFGLEWRGVIERGSPVDQVDVLVLGSFPEEMPDDGAARPPDSPRAAVQAMLSAVPDQGTIFAVNAPAWVLDLLAARPHHLLTAARTAAAIAASLA